jgi:hypothetical protein
MMSSEISTDTERSRDQLQPWQLFTLAGLAGATAVVFVTRDGGPAGVILLSITVGAAAIMGLSAWRTLAPLAGVHEPGRTEVLGGRTRAALEREKVLVLRSIKDLEFDRAMGKVSDKDFAEMSARLRVRATGLLRQLDRGASYRDEIEKEIAKRIGMPAAPAVGRNFSSGGTASSGGLRCACGTANESDARFCKKCGSRLEAA